MVAMEDAHLRFLRWACVSCGDSSDMVSSDVSDGVVPILVAAVYATLGPGGFKTAFLTGTARTRTAGC